MSAGIVTFLTVLIVAHVALTGGAAVYENPQSDANGLVQSAQPADDLDPTFRDIETAAEGNQGPDVLFYGEELYQPGVPPDKQLAMDPSCGDIGATLPVQWYMRLHGLTGDCAPTTTEMEARAAGSTPPAVVTVPERADAVAGLLPGYERRDLLISSRRGPRGGASSQLAVFIDTNRSTDG
jgi:predicted membrane-bound mannosyltransferase